MTWIGKHQRCCPETINPGWLLSDTCHATSSGRRLRRGKNSEIATACYNMIQLSWNLQLGNVNPPNDEQWEKKQLFGLQYSTVIQCIYKVLLPSIGITTSHYIAIYLGNFGKLTFTGASKLINSVKDFSAELWHSSKLRQVFLEANSSAG